MTRTTQPDAYADWRAQSLRRQLETHFSPRRLRGLDVLDFGCGGGELTCELAARWQCNSVVGVDLSETAISRAIVARERLAGETRDALRFMCSPATGIVELPDQSVDFICCFDVVEHIPDIAATAAEWQRLLRPGGEVWIWWSPWKGPYGHHFESLLPLPWVHLLASPARLFRACAEIYDDPAFEPRIWDIDPATGAKRPNKWRHTTAFEPFLNLLTRRNFESTVLNANLSIVERNVHGFSGSRLARATAPLTHLPVVGECFVSFFTYRLTRPINNKPSGRVPHRFSGGEFDSNEQVGGPSL